MGLFDFVHGRTENQRTRRAEKIRAKFGSHTGLTPAMLDALTRANDMPDEDCIELYQLAVPEGAEPTRVSLGYILKEARHQVCVLFPDGLSIVSREGGKQKKTGEKFPVAGAQLPFWGIQKVETMTLQNGDTALIVTGSDGKTPYRFFYVYLDSEEITSFVEDLNAARRVDAQKRATLPDATVTSSLSQEEQLAALRQMRDLTNMPDDAYQAGVRTIREGRSQSE